MAVSINARLTFVKPIGDVNLKTKGHFGISRSKVVL